MFLGKTNQKNFQDFEALKTIKSFKILVISNYKFIKEIHRISKHLENLQDSSKGPYLTESHERCTFDLLSHRASKFKSLKLLIILKD